MRFWISMYSTAQQYTS